jgi:hypothetical protein
MGAAARRIVAVFMLRMREMTITTQSSQIHCTNHGGRQSDHRDKSKFEHSSERRHARIIRKLPKIARAEIY